MGDTATTSTKTPLNKEEEKCDKIPMLALAYNKPAENLAALKDFTRQAAAKLEYLKTLKSFRKADFPTKLGSMLKEIAKHPPGNPLSQNA